jgi:hypothetical protein
MLPRTMKKDQMAAAAARHAAGFETQESNPLTSTATASELVAGTAFGMPRWPRTGETKGRREYACAPA